MQTAKRQDADTETFRLTYTGKGTTSRQDVSVVISSGHPGTGIVFRGKNEKTGVLVEIPARASNVVNTLRNVVLGKDGARICLVEHLLAAVAMQGLDDIEIEVQGPEIPLGDGSAQFWLDCFRQHGLTRNPVASEVELHEPIIVTKGDRSLMALPDQSFSLTYLMDWDHPLIGKCWQTWKPADSPEAISMARTFASLKEHQMLGLDEESVSLTADGFTKPLHYPDEPVRHKLLDLLGDLMLCGLNPLRIKARFVSVKGGHEMDVELAKRLEQVLLQSK